MNLKIVCRNLLKNKTYTIINTVGLAIGLAGFILVLLYVNYETSYEKWNPNANHIYRIIQKNSKQTDYSKYTPFPLAAQIKTSCSGIQDISTVYTLNTDLPFYAGERSCLLTELYGIDSTFFALFPYRVKYGSLNFRPNEMILSETTSKKLFGNSNPVGKVVTMGKDIHSEFQPHYTIAAVISTENQHSHFQFGALAWMPPTAHLNDVSWHNTNAITYLSKKPHTLLSGLTQQILHLYQQKLYADGHQPDLSIKLEPLTRIHLQPLTSSNHNLETVVLLSFLALLLLTIACINYINLSLAASAGRAKEVAMKKVLGAEKGTLVITFLSESFIKCMIALGLGLVLTTLLLPTFNQIVGLHLSLWDTPLKNSIIAELLAVLVLITLISGSYPAFFLAGYQPSKVLKGNYSRGSKDNTFKNTLLLLQFFITAIFAMGLFSVNKQIHYMRSQDLGFSPDQVLSITTFKTYSLPSQIQNDREKLQSIPGVKSVSVANAIPGKEIQDKKYFTYRNDSLSTATVNVSYDYFKTLNITLLAGRTFTRRFPSDTTQSTVINQSLATKLGVKDPVGKTISSCGKTYNIVGVIKDYYNNGFQNAIPPTAYIMNDPCDNNWKMHMLIKLHSANPAVTIGHLKRKWAKLNKADPTLRYTFLDKDYSKLFTRYNRISRLFTIATMVTLAIALIGLLALTAFIVKQRTKEISIRKVLGASNSTIIRMINSRFLKLILIANVLAWPVMYILVNRWLAHIAYRVKTPVIYFIVISLALLSLTFLITSIITWRSARINPAETLKEE